MATSVLTISAGLPTFVGVQTTLPTVYASVVTGSAVATGTAVTLPLSRTYSNTELQVFRNGQRLLPTTHYTYTGTIPRTQVTFTFDIAAVDEILFQILRDQ